MNIGCPDAFRIHKYSVLQAAGKKHVRRGRQLAFRVFRPPLRAKVQAPGGRPSWISARGIHGKVHTMAGPWRSSGEWWTPRAWSRDEWDVELAAGPLYRLYRDVLTAVWFVEGSYD